VRSGSTTQTSAPLASEISVENVPRPGQQNWDFSLIKNFNSPSGRSCGHDDFFNIWNHANFAIQLSPTWKAAASGQDYQYGGDAGG